VESVGIQYSPIWLPKSVTMPLDILVKLATALRHGPLRCPLEAEVAVEGRK
jgi:hypothetical protein